MNEQTRPENFYRAIVHTTMDGFCMVDGQGRLLDANEIFCRIIGYSREELLAMTIFDMEAMETPEETELHFQKIKEVGYERFETRLRRKDGQLRDIEISTHVVPDGVDLVLLAFLRDITMRNLSDTQKLKRFALQRDVLVREVYHHIKNNLQGVAALLQQQLEETPVAAAALEKAIARVKAVAVVHGLHGEANSQVALCDVVRAIRLDLQELTPSRLHLEMLPHFKPVLIDELESVPIALIINELLFNTIKHSDLKNADQGIIITLKGNQHEISLVISSKHGLLPQNFDFAAGRGLGTGLTLVKSLLPPAGANLSIANADGGVRTELRLTSPVLILANAARDGAS